MIANQFGAEAALIPADLDDADPFDDGENALSNHFYICDRGIGVVDRSDRIDDA